MSQHLSSSNRLHIVNDDQDSDDDIVGSYLSNDLDFLTAWSSINSSSKAPLPSTSTVQSSSWTPPSYSQKSHFQSTSHSSAHNAVSDPNPSMAAPYPQPQQHQHQQPGTFNNATPQQIQSTPLSHTKSVRKSSSGRRLKPQSSFPNLANAATTTTTTTGTTLPDPSLFPDPYPSVFGAGNTSTTPPVSLFSAGSSSARSSAYTSASPASALRSSVASSDSAHNARHLQQQQPSLLGTMPHQVGLASTADESVQLRDMDQQLNSAVTARPSAFSSQGQGGSGSGSRPATDYGGNIEKTRWSTSSGGANSQGSRSSWGNFPPTTGAGGGASGSNGNINRQSGLGSSGTDAVNYGWNHAVVDERDGDAEFASDDDDEAHDDEDGERTAAIVLAEKGHGEIVHGEGRDVSEVYVPSNTTHLLLGSSASPNQLPPFLNNTLPSISHSLLALDISSNYLVSLPLALAACRNLEELNIGSNPLRVLPTWLAVLTNLRVLIADSIGISTIPSTLSGAVQLHTLSVRNNRMHALPSWLCLLPVLEALYLDGNPFQGPWKALIEPLISRPISLAGPPQAVHSIPPPQPSPFYLSYAPHTPTSMESTDRSEYSEEKPTTVADVIQQAPVAPQGPPAAAAVATVSTGTTPPTKPFVRGHRANSSKDFNRKATLTDERPSTAGGRSRALTLDREKADGGGGGGGLMARSRPPPQEPISPRPYTSFSTHDAVGARSLSRTKTAPSRRPSASNSISSLLPNGGAESPGLPGFGRARTPSGAGRSTEMLNVQQGLSTPTGENVPDNNRAQAQNTIRKMKSTGDVKQAALMPPGASVSASASSTSVHDVPRNASMAELGGANPGGLGKFMSVGARGPMKEEYRALTATMFETPSTHMTPHSGTIRGGNGAAGAGKDKDKGKWGFLKKMSKSRLRSGSTANEDDIPGRSAIGSISGPSGHAIGPPRAMGGMGGPSESMPLVPHTSAANITPGITQPPLMTASQVSFRSATNLTQQQTSPQRRVLSKRTTDPVQQHPYSMISNFSVNPHSSSASTSSAATFAQSASYPNFQPSSQPPTPGLLAPPTMGGPPTARKAKRRSFLPVNGPAPLNIPATQGQSGFLAVDNTFDHEAYGGQESPGYMTNTAPSSPAIESDQKQRERHQRALRSVMGYLKDMCDLSAGTSAGAAAVAAAVAATQAQVNSSPNFAHFSSESTPASRGPSSRSNSRRPTLGSADASRALSEFSSMSLSTALAGVQNNSNPSPTFPPTQGHQHGLFPGRSPSFANLGDIPPMPDGCSMLESETSTIVGEGQTPVEEKKIKDDKVKRAMICKEIVTTERTYVKLLQELVDIYVTPAAAPVTGIANVSTKETMVPANERKVVFNGLESLLQFHKASFLPMLEQAYMTLESVDDVDGQASSQAAFKVAQVFVSHAAFMRMYSTYINNFDNALRRTKQWTDKNLASAVVGTGAAATTVGSNAATEAASGMNLTPSQRKRIKQYLKRCRANPRHSQMNMESYLLLPVQRIPRYRLLFEELVRATPPPPNDPMDNVLQRALDEITVLASNMNEGKREAESRRKLVHWQGRIRGKFPSPLVQPHRRLIMDGRLQLTRVVRKLANYFEVINASGEKTLVSVECLAPEVTPRPLVAILCNDLLVLCKDPSGGRDATGPVDLWAVLRMQTVQQPASIVHGSALRLVDNKAILYFDLPSTTEALTWSRAINMHIPASTK